MQLAFEFCRAEFAGWRPKKPEPLFYAARPVLYGLTVVAVQMIEPVRWAINEFVLIHSERRSQHHTIDRWSLEG